MNSVMQMLSQSILMALNSVELAYVNGLELTHAKKSNVTVQFLSLVKGSVECCIFIFYTILQSINKY